MHKQKTRFVLSMFVVLNILDFMACFAVFVFVLLFLQVFQHPLKDGCFGFVIFNHGPNDLLAVARGDRGQVAAQLFHGARISLLIGFVDTFGKVLWQEGAGALVYVLMAAILLWRPAGLFKAG